MPRVIKTEAWWLGFGGIAEINGEHLDAFTMCIPAMAFGQERSTHTVPGVKSAYQMSVAGWLIAKTEPLE